MEFDFESMFKKSFGYEPANAIKLEQSPGRKNFSKLGQPYYLSDKSGREYFLPVTINGILIPFAVIGMVWKKKILSTPMEQRSGSVHELINIEDYTFNIKGLLINDDNSYPENEINELHNLFTINTSISMRCVLSDIILNGSHDHKVIITEIKWPAIAGNEHAKPFELEVKSDMKVDLIKNTQGFIGPLQS